MMSLYTQKNENLGLYVAYAPCFINDHLPEDYERQIRVMGSQCLCRIMGHCLFDDVSNQQLSHEIQLRPAACIMCQFQLKLYGHMANFPEASSAPLQVVFKRVKEAKRVPTDLMAWADHCIFLGIGGELANRIVQRNPWAVVPQSHSCNSDEGCGGVHEDCLILKLYVHKSLFSFCSIYSLLKCAVSVN